MGVSYIRSGTVQLIQKWVKTATAAISTSIPKQGRPWAILEVRLHLSAAGGAAENFSLTINSGDGAEYDTPLLAQNMNAVQSLVWIPDTPHVLFPDDALDIAYVNTNTRTYGLTIVYEVL